MLSGLQPVADWSREDVSDWNRFLQSQAGLNLMARARALEARLAIAACGDPLSTTYSAARAAGFSDALKWLDSLSRVTGDQVTTDSAGDQQAEQYEQQLEGEAELLERLSP